jgi:hypothetical protein
VTHDPRAAAHATTSLYVDKGRLTAEDTRNVA